MKKRNKKYVLRPVSLELMGISALATPFAAYNSGSRVQMTGQHTSQAITPRYSSLPRCLMGYEQQLGEFVLETKVPSTGNCEVLDVVKRYPEQRGDGGLKYNPYTTVIFRNNTDGKIDFLDLKEYQSYHESFGSKHRIPRIPRAGDKLPAGKRLSESPNVKDHGLWSNSVEVNVAYFSDASTIEDGAVVSDKMCEDGAPLFMNKAVNNWGKKHYPLFIYGVKGDYKPHADVGEKIREDGLVFALREFNKVLDPVNMIERRLRQVDYVYDKCTYGIAGATVHDIKVESGIGESKAQVRTPAGMEKQSRKYIEAGNVYYTRLLDVYKRLSAGRRKPKLTGAMLELFSRAYGDTPNGHNKRQETPNVGVVKRQYKRTPLDEYRTEISFFKRTPLKKGDKITDLHGGKHVITSIRPRHTMPVDSSGVIADMLVFIKGGVARLNAGQFYEHYLGAVGIKLRATVTELVNDGDTAGAWDLLMAYYRRSAPAMHKLMLDNYDETDKLTHVRVVVEDGVRLYIRSNESHLDRTTVVDINKIAPPTYGPVSFINEKGLPVFSKSNVLIGPKSILILEKTDHVATAVSSGSRQHHGVAAGPSKHSRASGPGRRQAPRVYGQTEVRMYEGYCGAGAAATAMDLTNNPAAHKAALRAILSAKYPMLITNVVDRELIPMGGNRSLEFMDHQLQSMGSEIIEEYV